MLESKYFLEEVPPSVQRHKNDYRKFQKMSLRNQPVTAVPGIEEKLQEHLAKMKIFTATQLLQLVLGVEENPQNYSRFLLKGVDELHIQDHMEHFGISFMALNEWLELRRDFKEQLDWREYLDYEDEYDLALV